METLLEMLEKEGKTPDIFILMQVMRSVLLMNVWCLFHLTSCSYGIDYVRELFSFYSFDSFLLTCFGSLQSFLCRCYLHAGNLGLGLKTFEDYMKTDKAPAVELYLVSKCSKQINFLHSVRRDIENCIFYPIPCCRGLLAPFLCGSACISTQTSTLFSE